MTAAHAPGASYGSGEGERAQHKLAMRPTIA